MFDITQMTNNEIRREYAKNKDFQRFLHDMISGDRYEQFYQRAEEYKREYPGENIDIDEHINTSIKIYVQIALLKNETLECYLQRGE